MKKILIKIACFPLLISWLVTNFLFRLTGRFSPTPIWNYKGVCLIDVNRDLHLGLIDNSEGSCVEMKIYHNIPVGRRFISLIAENENMDQVHINVPLSSIKRKNNL